VLPLLPVFHEKDTPFVVLTGYTPKFADAPELAGTVILEKPVDFDLLSQALKTVIRERDTRSPVSMD
jgi:hypothetical protein